MVAWPASPWEGAALEAAPLTGSAWGAELVTSSVSFSLPSSDLYALDQDHFLRGLIGGTLARCWVSFRQGGTLYAPNFGHGGSSADPTVFVSALAAATAILVDLGTAARSADDVAQDFVDDCSAAGVTGISRVGATITIAGASDLTIPPNVDTTNTAERGMRGAVRDDWGDIGGSPNTTGGTDSTVSVHLGVLGSALGRSGRVIAVGAWGAADLGQGGVGPNMQASTGPVYSLSPTAMTRIGAGRIPTTMPTGPSAAEGGTCSVAVIAAGAFTATDNVWVHLQCHGAGVGGIRYRAHGRTPVGRGTVALNQRMIVDTTVTDDATLGLPDPYTPTVDSDFAIYGSLFVVVEFPDASGNYYADGRMVYRYGDHNPDRLHGTQTIAPPATLDIETTHHRELFPQWTEVEITHVTRAIRDIDVGTEAPRTRGSRSMTGPITSSPARPRRRSSPTQGA